MLNFHAFVYLLQHSPLLRNLRHGTALTADSSLGDCQPVMEEMARMYRVASGGERAMITAALWLLGPDAEYAGWSEARPEFTPDVITSADQQNAQALLGAIAIAMGKDLLAIRINPSP